MTQNIGLYVETIDKDNKTETGYKGDYIEEVVIPFGVPAPKKGIEYLKFSISELLKAEKRSSEKVTPLNYEKIYTECCYLGNKKFNSFKECIVGITTEEITDEKPQSSIFEYDLTQCDDKSIVEAILDLNTRVFRILGKKEIKINKRYNRYRKEFIYYKKIGFTLKDYLDLLAKAQNIIYVDKEEDADITISFNKNICFLANENFYIK